MRPTCLVKLFFLFLGTDWSAKIAQRRSCSPWIGLLFLGVPAAIVSIDRLTIDLAMAALCVGYVAARRFLTGWFALFAAGSLCGETGFLLINATGIDRLRAREYRRAVLALLAAAPALLWLLFDVLHTSADPTNLLSLVSLAGLVNRVMHPLAYPFSPAVNAVAQTLDYAALAAVPSLFGVSLASSRKPHSNIRNCFYARCPSCS